MKNVDADATTAAFSLELHKRRDGLTRVEFTTFSGFEDFAGGSLTVGYLTDEERIRLATALLHGLDHSMTPKWEGIAERVLLRKLKDSMVTA